MVHQDVVNPALSVVRLRVLRYTCCLFVCNFYIIRWKQAVIGTVATLVAVIAREVEFSPFRIAILHIGLLLYTHIVHSDLVVGI